MKKLLLFLVLIVTINVSAQSTTWFSKPLELDNVPASALKSDSVLVRGTDKIIKFVPRSEFGGAEQVNADWNAKGGISEILNKPEIPDVSWLQTQIDSKQPMLADNVNIKTINGNSLLGTGDIPIGNEPTHKTFACYFTKNFKPIPTTQVIYNDTGATITWEALESPGQYVGTFSLDLFDENARKYPIFIVGNTNIGEIVRVSTFGPNKIFVNTNTMANVVNGGGDPAIEVYGVHIKIEIYE
ncbi:hypothetical protein OIU80_19950 [Flavobacterium sp. LS1R47]|uniref:Uncharacterized protein n=1 Tax=Flavobacterium frigoritolerans TaxID=2987686 RepID=A0A9X3CAD4_9FLAO|nr:hypothetical protein [Flavobacterium frigoritolerans]MCV9934561.1 hypothetical protein [Flavobacterium frigoritolerans]